MSTPKNFLPKDYNLSAQYSDIGLVYSDSDADCVAGEVVQNEKNL